MELPRHQGAAVDLHAGCAINKELTLRRGDALLGIRGASPVEAVVSPADVGLKILAGSVGYGVALERGDIDVFHVGCRFQP